MRTRVRKNFVELKSVKTTVKMKLTQEQMKAFDRQYEKGETTVEEYYKDSFQYSFKAPAKISFGKESVFSEVYVNVMSGDPVVIDIYRVFDGDTNPLYMDKDPRLNYGIELLDRFILIGATGTVDRLHKQLCEAIAEMELEKA